jgi:hypothetical protein
MVELTDRRFNPQPPAMIYPGVLNGLNYSPMVGSPGFHGRERNQQRNPMVDRRRLELLTSPVRGGRSPI